jgi:hypothetical protein
MTEKARLSDLIRESHALAALCAELASQEADAQERDDLLAMAQGWVHLARSYEYAASILLRSPAASLPESILPM